MSRPVARDRHRPVPRPRRVAMSGELDIAATECDHAPADVVTDIERCMRDGCRYDLEDDTLVLDGEFTLARSSER